MRENLRFATYKAKLNDTPVFIKISKQAKLHKALFDEAVGLKNMRELDTHEKLYRTPQLIEVAEGILVTSWEEGHLMVEEFNEGNANLETHLEILLALFVYIDSRSTGGIGANRFMQAGKPNGVEKVIGNLTKLNYDQYIESSTLLDLAEFLKPLLGSIETRFTHGDLQPGNILIETKRHVPTIIDCESCSWLWPRHYNIINFIFNYSIGHTHPDMMDRFHEMFSQYLLRLKLEKADVLQQVNVIAGMRALQSVYEHLGDYTDKREGKPLDNDYTRSILKVAKKIMANEFFLD